MTATPVGGSAPGRDWAGVRQLTGLATVAASPTEIPGRRLVQRFCNGRSVRCVGRGRRLLWSGQVMSEVVNPCQEEEPHV